MRKPDVAGEEGEEQGGGEEGGGRIRKRKVQQRQVRKVEGGGGWRDRGAGSHQTSWTGSLPL